MSTISLCMIAQDEEHCLAKGIENCQDYVDEIVILDGGSVDCTMDIAKSFPKVRLYQFPFDRHFANQKNRCQEKATCDWILWKDADETFELDVLENLQRLTLYKPYCDYDVFAFPRKTYLNDLLINLSELDFQIRFWKNNMGIHYVYRIHEQIQGYDAAKKLNINAWIRHHKTPQMQQQDNELYWEMGQPVPPGWVKRNGTWEYDKEIDEQLHEKYMKDGEPISPGWIKKDPAGGWEYSEELLGKLEGSML